MKVLHLSLFYFALTLSIIARAGEVTILSALPDDIYSVSKDPKREWLVNDRICFRRLDHKGRDINFREILACGQVLDILEEDFLVHITSRNVKLTAGAKLKVWRPGGVTYQRTAEFAKRTISTLNDPLEQRVFSLGVQFMSPFLHIEQGISNSLLVGFQPSYTSQKVGLGTIRGFSYHLTLSYFFDELLRGPFAMVGAGILFYQGKANLNEVGRISPSVHLSAGYRFLLLNDRLAIGLAAGGQYVVNHRFSQFILDWNGLLPAVILQVGYKF